MKEGNLYCSLSLFINRLNSTIMKHVLLNPERYRLPDYPFIEKSERGCSSAGVGTIDRGGREEDGYHINRLRFFYQGKQCYFFTGDINNPEYNSTTEGYFDLIKRVGSQDSDIRFRMIGISKDNPTLMNESYQTWSTSSPSEDVYEPGYIIDNIDTLFDDEYLMRGFGGVIAGKDTTGKISGRINDRYVSSYPSPYISIIPYISESFQPLIYNIKDMSYLEIVYDSYQFSCGCLDLNISSFVPV